MGVQVEIRMLAQVQSKPGPRGLTFSRMLQAELSSGGMATEQRLVIHGKGISVDAQTGVSFHCWPLQGAILH